MIWTDLATNNFWLRDSLPGNLQNKARILNFQYDATAFFDRKTTTWDVEELIRKLCRLLEGVRKGLGGERPLIFMCYSLGGLIAKEVSQVTPY